MALKFFKQRDIDEMDAGNIPDSFVSYFESLSKERKEEIISARPELAIGLGYTIKSEDVAEVVSKDTSDSLVDDMVASLDDLEQSQVEPEDEDIFSQIRVNRYEHEDLDKFFVDGARPLEVLTIPDKTEKCVIHRCKFEKKNIKYRSKNGSTYGVVLNLCRECKRVYQEESHVEYVHQALMDRHISHTFYDIGLTSLYLKSNQSAYVMEEQEKIYVPDVWVEENPVCPIHGEALYELVCEKHYGERKVTFPGYYCDQCNKVLIRKANVSELVDACAMNGIPEIETEPLVKQKPLKKPIPKREIRPDFFIQDGKRQAYDYDYTADCYKLTEDDTVVISDSIYCNLDGHDTKEVLALIMVKQKREGRKAYLFMVGYCAECQKYYMDEEDYRVVYGLGRPEVTILSNLESDDYHITSGEVFNLERTHLQNLEDEISGEILDIHQQPDYVNPYASGDYDDGNLSFAKQLSKNKYSERLDKLGSYQSKPYNYRVDITANGETETYYVGVEDIELDDGSRVISFNSDFGHELVNYQTIKVNKNGKEYDIKLSRQFDIENATLFGYANLRTDEDIIFRSGVTDPFLVRVLNMRKKQHNLIDIIATIQENQNKIVDADFERSIIVQGCAGSGKTMVLLHRLSSLQYKNRYFDFGDKALILTPNDQFSLHIKGLAEGLQLGNINRESVEQYYTNMLIQYSMDFRPDTKLVSEMMVRQDFVDYIYSDQFIQDFDRAYEKVIADRNRLVEILDNLTEAMGQPNRMVDFKDDTRVVEQIRFGTQAMESIVKQHALEVDNAKTKLQKVISRKEFLDKKIPESEEFVNGVTKECLPRVYKKISEYMSRRQSVIDQLKLEQEQLTIERQKVQSTILMFGKKAKLEELDKDINKIEQKVNLELKKQEDELKLLNISQEGKTDEDIVAWMEQVMLLIKEVQDEVRLYKNAKGELERYLEEKVGIVDELIKAQQTLGQVAEQTYSDEVTKAIQYLYQRTDEYTILGTYQMIFNEAVSTFKESNNIKTIVGKYHRYDLYAELLFAKRYFKSVRGNVRFMCVDEGQDLALNEYRLIAELNRNEVIFNIFGDVNQLMKPGRGIADWSDLKTFCNAEQYILNENYRNTNQITRFCNSSFGMDVLQTGVDGTKVREIARKELETELSALNIAHERLAILVPRGVQKRKYLKNDLLPIRIVDVIGEKIGNGLISLLYVDEAKGIEFDKVYVVGNKMERNEKYIAYTRALSELIIVVDESVEDYDDGSEKSKNSIRKDKNSQKLKNKTKIGKGTLVWEDNDHIEESDAVLVADDELQQSMISKKMETDLKQNTNDVSDIDFQEDVQIQDIGIEGAEQSSPDEKYLEKVVEIPLSLIEVPSYILKSNPSQEKIDKILEYYKTYGKFDKPIRVKVRDGRYIIKSKYLRYYVAKMLNLEKIAAVCVEDKADTSMTESTSEKEIETITPLKSIAGAALKEGTYLTGDFTQEQIRDALYNVFSDTSKKDTSYKFVFLKSIIDCMYDYENEDGFKLSFDQLFYRFTEIYWPIVVNYGFRQKVGAGNKSYAEQIIAEASIIYGMDGQLQFSELTKSQQNEIVKDIKKKCKNNVVGALYGDTKRIFYSFSKKDEWVEINPLVLQFLNKNQEEIQKMNYVAWAKFMTRISDENDDIKTFDEILKILNQLYN